MPTPRLLTSLRGALLVAALSFSFSALTGAPAQAAVTVQDACASAPAGYARCDAQVLVHGPHHRLVRPRVHRVALHFNALAAGQSSGPAAVSQPQPGTPLYLQQAYDLTALSASQGAGKTIAVIDAFNDPTVAADLATFRSTYGLPACTTASGCLQVINEYGQSAPLPPNSTSWSVEESLDLDAVSALCPNCKLVLVEANASSSQDMQNAIQAAVGAGAAYVSNSWSAEASSSPFTTDLSFPGVSVLAASGDNGTLPAGYNNYPAALATVTAVGGTQLQQSSASGTTRGFTEAAWNNGGSGCDTTQTAPAWQPQTGCAGRAYSDISADGDPATGLNVYDSQEGGWVVVGGTSLATPLAAAFEAVTGVNGTTPQWAYTDAALLNDVTGGTNGSCAVTLVCNAAAGWDGPTGVGSISGDVVNGAPGLAGPGVVAGSGDTYTQSTTGSTATLSAGIYTNGEATSYYWQYGTSTGYGSQSAPVALPAAASVSPLTSTLGGLAPSTTYHYRLVASNASGTTYGYDFTFTTAYAPAATVQSGGGAAQSGRSATKPVRHHGKPLAKPARGSKRHPAKGRKHHGKGGKHHGKGRRHPGNSRRHHGKALRHHGKPRRRLARAGRHAAHHHAASRH